MNGAYFSKIRADLLGRPFQNSLILAVLAIAAATLTLAINLQVLASDSWDKTFTATNGANLWLFTSGENSNVSEVTALPGVKESTGAIPYLKEQFILKGSSRFGVSLYGFGAMPPSVNRPLLVEGRWLEATATNQIVLDLSFARNLKLKAGDRVDFETRSNGRISLEVVGLAVNTIQGIYPDTTPGLTYVLPTTLSALEPDKSLWSYTFGIKLLKPEASEPFIEQARRVLKTGFGWYNAQSVRDELEASIRINAIFLGLFGSFALLVSGFVVAGAISSSLLSRSREIGLLKTSGFTPGQVLRLFMLEYLLLGLFGTIFGMIAGSLLTPFFQSQLVALLNLPPELALNPLLLLGILLAMEIAIGLFTLLPSWKGGRMSVVAALNGGAGKANRRPSRLAGLALRLKMPIAIVTGVKEYPPRAALTVISLVLAIITAIFVVSTQASLVWLTEAAMKGLPYDMALFRADISDNQTQQIIKSHSEIETYYTFTERPAASGKVEIVARAVGGDYQKFPFTLIQGSLFSTPGEAVVGVGLLEALGLKVGDKLMLDLIPFPPGSPVKTVKLHITGSYVVTNHAGKVVVFGLDTLKLVEPRAEAISYGLKLAPTVDKEVLRQSLLSDSNGKFDITLSSNELPEQVQQVRFLVTLLGAVLLISGLAGLINSGLTRVREQFWEIGILKTVGFTPFQLLLSTGCNIGVLVVISVIPGLLLGLVITRVLFDLLLGHGQGVLPGVEWLLAIVTGTLILTLLSVILPGLIAARIKPLEVLRYE